MNYRYFGMLSLSLALLGMMTVGCGTDSGTTGGTAGTGGAGGSGPPAECNVAAPAALATCVDAVNQTRLACYLDTDSACESSAFDSALTTLKDGVEASCSDDEFNSLTVDALVARLQTSCTSETGSIEWRTFGGPQGAVWADAFANQKACMRTAHETASALVNGALTTVNECLAAGNCDPSALGADAEAAAAAAVSDIEAACQGTARLDFFIAVTPDIYVDRTLAQVDCMVATSHADTAPLTLGCGPSNVDMDPPRGEYQQIIVDGDKWGTLCGDGTEYAFLIRLAPEGEPLDRIVIGLEGGGVCFTEGDCAGVNPALLNAQDNEEQEAGGIMSNDPDESPFANWTKVYLPYCNQDVFAGAGVVEDFGLPRYGAVNLRSSIQMVRDLIWKLMDEEDGDGFRPDELVTLFGGFSAGGYGSLYNYHWLLDDLLWPRTAAFPDASGALDNGQALGVRIIGLEFIPKWGARPNLPPYCFTGDCAVGPFLYNAISPRLRTVPEQQMLILTNQQDGTQQGDAFFLFDDDENTLSAEAVWMNTLRSDYCDTKDLNGIHYYYSTEFLEKGENRVGGGFHVISLRPDFYEREVAGIALRDWLEGAITDPDNVVDRAEEGTFVDDIPGTAPFPCEVAP
ncbi:MAG: hypothetical protein JRF42_08115 [Deltaproteobacteria bacterium]|nr:hypothetical protein [Deltaproteobacteria bacterium]